MRIAIIGSGVSGLVAARILATKHDVHLFEAANYVGGHANTVNIDLDGQTFAVDTGFMVFNERTYPNFVRMLRALGIPPQPSDMSFSVSCENSGLEYQGSSLTGLFAQRSNLLRPRFYRMLSEILRFNRIAQRFVQSTQVELTVGEFLARHRLGAEIRDNYLLPMTAAIWSCPFDEILCFPARLLLMFMQNHGLLQLTDRPRWLTVPGGSRRYIQSLTKGMGSRVRLNSPIASVRRYGHHVKVQPCGEAPQVFDAVVMATHADTTLRLLKDADPHERELLAAFPYRRNEAILHTDESWLPRRRAAWASWNYRITKDTGREVCVTYDVGRLQRINSHRRLLVTLNPPRPVDENQVLGSFTYHHPVFSLRSSAAQSRWDEINGSRRTYYCGAYWRHGFHEDGIVSALEVTKKFDLSLDSCTAPCTAGPSSTLALSQ